MLNLQVFFDSTDQDARIMRYKKTCSYVDIRIMPHCVQSCFFFLLHKCLSQAQKSRLWYLIDEAFTIRGVINRAGFA